jgi:hypothetical protein
MNEYGMYSPRGNDLVDGVVRVARKEGWDWPKTYRHLELLARAHPTAAAECLDTAVREEVYAALGFETKFYT